MLLRSYGVSDIGKRRPVNEDSFLSDDELGLFIVADGVGGHAKGEIASAQSVEEVHGYVRDASACIEALRRHAGRDEIAAVRRLLESAVQSAGYMVFGMAELDPTHHGMSTTMSALLVVEGLAIIAQVGDSRVYRRRGEQTAQLTEDHTLFNYRLKHGLLSPQEARQSAGKNVITRAVGHRDYVQVDTLVCDAQPGDRYLLCSDGLHGQVHDDEVGSLLALAAARDAAHSLVELANDRGGRDNITVLVVDALAATPTAAQRRTSAVPGV
ncbi:MAG: serine/threonine-protein phosphatase [Proteobacteria bacterium]|nr:serine/threonine-protein phosphatase [Pseudomonadota bacterium]